MLVRRHFIGHLICPLAPLSNLLTERCEENDFTGEGTAVFFALWGHLMLRADSQMFLGVLPVDGEAPGYIDQHIQQYLISGE